MYSAKLKGGYKSDSQTIKTIKENRIVLSDVNPQTGKQTCYVDDKSWTYSMIIKLVKFKSVENEKSRNNYYTVLIYSSYAGKRDSCHKHNWGNIDTDLTTNALNTNTVFTDYDYALTYYNDIITELNEANDKTVFEKLNKCYTLNYCFGSHNDI